jgi:uncharacterized protein
MTEPPISSMLADPRERIASIDVLRGLALFGIVVVNAWFFAFPMTTAMDLNVEISSVDTAAIFVVMAFFTFKFISIFSVLFGFGIAMQRARLIARTGRSAGFLARRMTILGIFGLLHALLLWYGDILFQYAIVGMMMILLIQLPAKARLGIGLACLVVSMVASFGFGLLAMISAPEVGDPDLTLRGFAAMQAANFDPASPIWTNAETVAFRDGPFADAFLFRTTIWLFAAVFFFLTYGWHVLGLVLVGSWFHDVGLFRPEGRRLLGNLAIWGIAIGLPVEMLLAFGQLSGDPGPWLGSAMGAAHDLSSAILALGIIGLVGRACAAGRMPLASGLASVGRMSLSAYILESVVFLWLVSFWGLQQFGNLGYAELVLVSIGVYGLVAIFCVLWLRRFRMGPLEWLWRTASYLGRPATAT